MDFSCNRLLAAVNCHISGIFDEDSARTFVEFMDMALKLLQPLTLCPIKSATSTNISMSLDIMDFAEKGQKIRSTIEKLIPQALAFICVLPENDKQPLITLCHKVMLACIEFYDICCVIEYASEDDKRMKAENVQYSLHNLDRLVNDCLMRLSFVLFVELNENPIARLQFIRDSIIGQKALESQIDRFDNTLDRMIQIGTFAAAYSQNAKCKERSLQLLLQLFKHVVCIHHMMNNLVCFSLSILVTSNLQSCLSSVEALGSYLIPSALAKHYAGDFKLLEQHWNDSINIFRSCVHEAIDTPAFCSVLIDTMDDIVSQLRTTLDTNNIRVALQQCEVLLEHIQLNQNDNGKTKSVLRLYYGDLRIMITECQACLRSSIGLSRLRKRFCILLSVLRNIEKFLEYQNIDAGEIDQQQSCFKIKPSTHVRENTSNNCKTESNEAKPDYNSLEMAMDLDEFISKNGSIRHISMFYDTKRKCCELRTFAQNSSKIHGDEDITPKRAPSKRK